MKRLVMIAGMALVLAACAEKPAEVGTSPEEALALINQENLTKHLEYLSSDELEGREPGKEGYQLAAKYVAEQYAAIGLEPGGDDGGWYHQVQLQTYQVDPGSAEVTLHLDSGDVVLEYREDFAMYGDKVRAEDEVRAEVVYIGRGVHAPELGYSDLEGLDLDGKIVALFSGGPAVDQGR